jgi:hypothetical protein
MDIDEATKFVEECAARLERARMRVQSEGMMNRRSGEEGERQAAQYALAVAEEQRAYSALRAAQDAYAKVPYASEQPVPPR